MSRKVRSKEGPGATPQGRQCPPWPRHLVLGILFTGSLVPPVVAQETLRRVTLEQALQMFEENNLELRLVMAERDEAAGLARQATAHPNPVATFTHEGLSQSDLDHSESYFTASQRLEWPGRRSNRTASADEAAAAATARLDAERQRLVFEVRRAFLRHLCHEFDDGLLSLAIVPGCK